MAAVLRVHQGLQGTDPEPPCRPPHRRPIVLCRGSWEGEGAALFLKGPFPFLSPLQVANTSGVGRAHGPRPSPGSPSCRSGAAIPTLRPLPWEIYDHSDRPGEGTEVQGCREPRREGRTRVTPKRGTGSRKRSRARKEQQSGARASRVTRPCVADRRNGREAGTGRT